MGHGQEEEHMLRSDLGRWVLRAGPLSIPNPVPPPMVYWQGVALTVPLLAQIGISVFSVAPSEACVERSFSHQSLLHSDLRNRMSDQTVQSLMYSTDCMCA